MTYSLSMILKAIASNQVARFAPSFYVRLTGQTGRGDSAQESPAEIADYFRKCIADYAAILGIPDSGLLAFLQDKVVLEYGPGDLPGVALLLVAYGARKVYCVDRFPLVSISNKNLGVIQLLASELDAPARERFDQCFIDADKPQLGFNPARIEYLIRPNGLSGLQGAVDLVISRAVLEHVNDLDATFDDMLQAMKPGGLSVHQVDLRSHGLHVDNPLDFLAPPEWLWRLMHSHKGVPNRWRADRYAAILQKHKIRPQIFQPTEKYPLEVVKVQLPRLATPFQEVDEELLRWQGFWLAFSRPENNA